MDLSLKLKVFEEVVRTVQSKIDLTLESVRMLQASANEETKSSAGDKYETGRAMAQLEIEKLSSQLGELRKQKQILDQIRPETQTDFIQVGSLIGTADAIFFIAISLGKVVVDGKHVFCLSPFSPIGAKLMGRKLKDAFDFQGKQYQVVSFC